MNKRILAIVLIVMLIDIPVSFVPANSIKNRISYKIGWPVVIENDIVLGPPTLADLDNNGTVEIILGSSGDFAPDSGKIYVLEHNGILMENFPIKLGYLAGGIPSVGDINNDGFLEIIDDAVINGTAHSKIHALSYLGDSITGWPIQTNGWYSRSSLSDINGDRYLDILIGGAEAGTNNFYLYAYNHNGDNLSGNWPSLVSCPEGMQAIGDINNDSNLEIAVGTSFYGFNGGIYVFDHNGNIMPGWPIETGKRFPAPITLADLNNDGNLEIIATDQDGFLYVYYHNGTKAFDTQTRACLYKEVVPVDLDDDGDLELIVPCETAPGSSEYELIAFHLNGEIVDGWPVTFEGTPTGGGSANGESSVIVGDIDNDCQSEILISSRVSDGFLINAWNCNSSIVDNFPIHITTDAVDNGGLALGDLDGDGSVELVFIAYEQSLSQGIYRTEIHVFDLNAAYHQNTMAWPQFHHDAQHTGLYVKANSNSPPNAPSITGPASGKAGQQCSYTFNSTDPNSDDVYYYVDWGDTTSGWVGPFASGVDATVNHTWTQTGVYAIIAKAKDIYDDESNWSELFTVSILQRALLIGLIHNVNILGDYIEFVPILVLAIWLSPFNINNYSYGLMMISKNYSGFVGKLFIIGMFDAAVVTNRSTSIYDSS